MVCIVYVQPMYQPAVNDQFTGYNYGSTTTAIGSPFLVLKKQHPVKVLLKEKTLSNTILTHADIRFNRRTVPTNDNSVPILKKF